ARSPGNARTASAAARMTPGVALASPDVTLRPPPPRRDLGLWMVALRRVALVGGVVLASAEAALVPGTVDPGPIVLIASAVGLVPEVGGALLRRVPDAAVGLVVNAQIALETLGLALLRQYGGGHTNVAILFFAPAFFVYGAVLPLPFLLAHVGLSTLAL